MKRGLGRPCAFFTMGKAMAGTGVTPDFVTVAGAEGGADAASLGFADHTAAALRQDSMPVHNRLVCLDLRGQIKIIGSGKLVGAFAIVSRHYLRSL